MSYSLTEKEKGRIRALVDDIEKNSANDKEKKTKMSALLKSELDMSAKIDLLGGEIKVESEVGKGTAFTVKLAIDERTTNGKI